MKRVSQWYNYGANPKGLNLIQWAFQTMESSVSMTSPVSTIYHLSTIKYSDFIFENFPL